MNKSRKQITANKDSKRITLSDSFETVQDSQISYWAGLKPAERFTDFYKLMSRFYDFEKPVWKSKKIVIDGCVW
jgi:hypothetical protein